MAYQNYLHSVSETQVKAFLQDQRESLQISHSVVCSHLIAYWIQVHPLAELLYEALDGGETFALDLPHPFRSSRVHSVESVKALYLKLKEEWEKLHVEQPVDEEDWYAQQIEEVIGLFAWACSRDELVVSSLEPSLIKRSKLS